VIDLHAHLIPGVDDGAETLEQALELCRRAAAEGCTALVATPHRRRDQWPDLPRRELATRLEALRAALGPEPEVLLGSETRVDSELCRELDRGDGEAAIELGGSRTLLLELEPHGLGPDPVALVGELAARGFRALVAHPEHVPFLRREPELAAALVEAGAFLQVTAMSVTGELGRPARDVADALFDAGLVHVVASDAHRPHWRPTGLARARARIVERWGEGVAEAVTAGNPRALLADLPLLPPCVAPLPLGMRPA
jgi:protein-tyrosine phosphatase